MAEDPAGFEHLLEQVVRGSRCEVCRRRFEEERVRVAARHDQLWIVSVRCRRCRHQQVFYLAPSDVDPKPLGDLTEAEEVLFSEGSPVSCDDVLDMHEFLQAFGGDFKRLFE